MKKDVNKSLQEGSKKPKGIDKTLVVAISICVAIALLVVGIVTLPEPITAAKRLKDAKSFLAAVEEPAVLLNSAGEYTGLLETKEALLEDDSAEDFVSYLSVVLENAKYSSTSGAAYGVWKTKIVVYNSTDKLDVYIDSEGIYILHNERLIEYRIAESGAEEHKAILEIINDSYGAEAES